MASALMRRSVLTAAMAAIATVASPLATAAFAATPSLAAPTFTTSPADSSGTVKANQPTFTATYNTALAQSSTITLKDTSASSASVPCAKTVSSSAIKCVPTSSLTDGHVYTVTVHAVNAATSADSRTDTSKAYTIDIPSVVAGSVKPAPSSTVGSGTTKVQATFDEAIDTDAANSFVRITNVNGNTVPGSTTFTKSGSPNPLAVTDTIVFSPAVPDGTYQVHIHVSASGNTAAFADVNFSYSVNGTPPPAGPTVSTAGYTPDSGATHWINSNNQSKVPFAGTAPDGFSVGVVVYQAATTAPPGCSHAAATCTNDRSTTIPVTDCGKDFCPWSGTIDLSSTPAGNYQYWVYSFSAGGKVPAAPNTATDPAITKDTTAPSAPTFTPSDPVGTDAVDGSDASATTMHVAAQDLDSSTFAYVVQATDAVGKTDSAGFAAGGNNTHDGATDLPVGDLEDGASNSEAAPLTVDVFAEDKAGNLSADPNGLNESSVEKDTRKLTPDFADSYVTVDGHNIKFASIDGKHVHTPTSVTVVFNEILRPSDVNGKTTYFTSGMCFADNTGLCLGGSNAITPDLHGVTFTLADQTVSDTGSPYQIKKVVAVAGTCPDTGNAGCEHYASTDGSPNGGSVLSFVVDNGPPSVTIDTATLPNPITADTVKATNLDGWADPDTATVSLLIKDSAGGNQVVPSSEITVAPPATDPNSSSCTGSPTPHDCQATWKTKDPVDLSNLANGTLSIIASATDTAGNAGANDSSSKNPDGTARIATVALQARPSAPQNLSVAAGNGRAVLAWLAPATNGGHPLTGYSLTIADKTAHVTAAPVSIAPAATSYTVNSLTNGHLYTFTLSAANDIHSGVGAATSATPKGNTALSELASPGIITYGQAFTLSGSLTYLGAPLAGQPLKITSKYYNGAVGPHYNVTTDQNGHWAVGGIKPTRKILFTVAYAGNGAYNASSHAIWERVRAAIKVTKISAGSRSHTSPVTITGSVSPNEHGYRVYVYELRSGKLVKIGSARLSSKSTWSLRHTFSKGTHRIVAKIFAHLGDEANQTGRVRIVRT